MSVSHVYVPGVHRCQERGLNSVKWELDTGVRSPLGARNETPVSPAPLNIPNELLQTIK